jgi:hypothetical protein
MTCAELLDFYFILKAYPKSDEKAMGAAFGLMISVPFQKSAGLMPGAHALSNSPADLILN